MATQMIDSNPFDALLAVDFKARSESSMADKEVTQDDWSGVLFRVSNSYALAPMSMLLEIVPPMETSRIPGVKPWLKGVGNLHGSLLPVVDLQGFLFGKNLTQSEQSQRMLVVSDGEHKIGLLTNEVFGMKHFQVSDEVNEMPEVQVELRPYITAALQRFDEHFAVFNINQLLSDPAFLDAAV